MSVVVLSLLVTLRELDLTEYQRIELKLRQSKQPVVLRKHTLRFERLQYFDLILQEL